MKTELHNLAHTRQEIEQTEEQRKAHQIELEQSSLFQKIQRYDKVLKQLKAEAEEDEEAVRKLAFNKMIADKNFEPPGCTVERVDGLPVITIKKNLTEFL